MFDKNQHLPHSHDQGQDEDKLLFRDDIVQ